MTRIPLRARDGSVHAYALVDDADCELASRYTWGLRAARSGTSYVAGRVDGRIEYLHRLLMGLTPGDGLEVDHRDGNPLDCRRGNMRVVTHAEQQQNQRRRRKAGASRFRGVSWFPQRGYWRARVAGRTVGYRRDEVEAAVLAEDARRELQPFAEPCPELARALAGVA